MIQTAVNPISRLEDILAGSVNMELSQTTLILSYGMKSGRSIVKEFYGRDFQQTWQKLSRFYRRLPETDYLRIDLIVEEHRLSYLELIDLLGSIKRNNYIDFGLRFVGLKKRLLLKEELTANAVIVPDNKHKVGKNKPNLHIDFPNYRNYMQQKYGDRESSLKYIETAAIFSFKTKAFLLENDLLLPLKDYGNGNHFREIDLLDFSPQLDSVIEKGGNYLLNQLQADGSFTYGYFPCYGKIIPNYNAIRHFSSIYALLETGELLENQKMIQQALQGLVWGFDHLGINVADHFLIKEEINGVVEYKLGAQSLAILAAAKYTQITGDERFFSKMKTLTQTIENLFFTAEDETVHVLDQDLAIKERFRIVYYDGEALFSMLRAYGLMKDPEMFALCQRLMDHFVENRYERYHDHWLSYAVNEFLLYEEKVEYYRFGVANALNKIDFMKQRDTAYPTMLELLVAAAKMMKKLAVYENRNQVMTDEAFLRGQDKIENVMEYRAYHELVTGTMFPELAMFFKEPIAIEYGFFARHDRFRMRIDDAEHFLSGLINYRQFMKGGI